MMGDRGRLVIPAGLRDRLELGPGTPLLLFETPHGIVMATRDQAKQLVRDRLRGGPSLVDELLADRRALAAAEDRG